MSFGNHLYLKNGKDFDTTQIQKDMTQTCIKLLDNIELYTEYASGLKLRAYQREAARIIINSILCRLGLTIVIIFPRQSGKNEVQAQIEVFLLTTLSRFDVEIIKVSPTWRPQTLNAMRRLQRVLRKNITKETRCEKESGHIQKNGRARIFFLSGSPTANVVGATANLLLECDEAQDVHIFKWDKDFAPMAASTNATRVFWGTIWTSNTLLAREMRTAQELEARDGIRRVFLLKAEDVAKEVPSYERHVAEQVKKLGRQHPMVKTQYFSEEIEGQCRMFPPRRLALMKGDQLRQYSPTPGRTYAVLIDVAGEDEGLQNDEGIIDGRFAQLAEGLENPRRDATALTVVEVDLNTLKDELLQAPVYRVVNRRNWIGVKHPLLYGQILTAAYHWHVMFLVVDATGVGAGLASFLERALPGKVIPFTFSSVAKSSLGWDYLALIEAGRFKDYAVPPGKIDDEQEGFELEAIYCQADIQPGPERKMRWGVPDGTRDTSSGKLVHDDWLISAALCAVLDKQEWRIESAPLIIQAIDPLEDMETF